MLIAGLSGDLVVPDLPFSFFADFFNVEPSPFTFLSSAPDATPMNIGEGVEPFLANTYHATHSIYPESSQASTAFSPTVQGAS